MTPPRERPERIDLPKVTIAAIALVAAAFAAELARGVDGWRPGADDLRAIGGGPDASTAWQLAIAPLVHLGALHLAWNAIGFALVGPPLERALGKAATCVIFAGGALAGAALHVARQPYELSVGASGATFAAAAALAVLAARAPARTPRIRLAIFAAANAGAFALAALADVGARPDGWAHAGGALAGALVALIANRSALRTAAAALAVGAGVAALVATSTPPIDWRAELARAAELERHLDDIVPDSLAVPDRALATRLDAEVALPLADLAAHLARPTDDPRMPAGLVRRRDALRAYTDARLRAVRALERYVTTGDASARADFDAADRDATRALQP